MTLSTASLLVSIFCAGVLGAQIDQKEAQQSYFKRDDAAHLSYFNEGDIPKQSYFKREETATSIQGPQHGSEQSYFKVKRADTVTQESVSQETHQPQQKHHCDRYCNNLNSHMARDLGDEEAENGAGIV